MEIERIQTFIESSSFNYIIDLCFLHHPSGELHYSNALQYPAAKCMLPRWMIITHQLLAQGAQHGDLSRHTHTTTTEMTDIDRALALEFSSLYRGLDLQLQAMEFIDNPEWIKECYNTSEKYLITATTLDNRNETLILREGYMLTQSFTECMIDTFQCLKLDNGSDCNPASWNKVVSPCVGKRLIYDRLCRVEKLLNVRSCLFEKINIETSIANRNYYYDQEASHYIKWIDDFKKNVRERDNTFESVERLIEKN